MQKACQKLNSITKNEKIKYNFDINDKSLNIRILDCCNVSMKKFRKEHTFPYELSIFNKEILNLIKMEISDSNYYNYLQLMPLDFYAQEDFLKI